MSTYSDCPDEMPTPRSFDEADATSLVAGQVPSGHPDLAAVAEVVGDLRKLGDGPVPKPSPALAALFEAMPEGDAAPVDPVSSPTRRKRMLRRVGTALSGMNLAAKTGAGAAAALIGLTTAAGAGVLGGSAHDVVSDVVGAVTPLDLKDSDSVVGDTTGLDDDVTDDLTNTTLPDLDDVTNTTLPGGDEATDDGDGGGQPANHGACVSAVARAEHESGRAHGQAVSQVARSDCGKTPGDDDITTTTLPGDDDDVTTTTLPDGDDDNGGAGGNRGPGSSGGPGNSGKGSGGNQGQGNSGGGNPGRGR